jgi:hypothetical protein
MRVDIVYDDGLPIDLEHHRRHPGKYTRKRGGRGARDGAEGLFVERWGRRARSTECAR